MHLLTFYWFTEEEAWISEKQQLLTVPDLGDNMAAVQGLIKKHDAFEGDISVHGERYDNYIFKGDGAFNYFFLYIYTPFT